MSQTDIEHFSLSAMSKHNLGQFESTLPDHLREIFCELWLHGENYFPVNVLQGYEDITENGVKLINFRYGATKKLNLLPILGTLIWIIHRKIQDTTWHTLYFDATYGSILTEQEASELRNKTRAEL